MRIDVIGVFPQIVECVSRYGVVGRAIESKKIQLYLHDLHTYTKKGRIDDYPYGGGPGMVIKPEPIFAAMDAFPRGGYVILPTPHGYKFTQECAKELANKHHLVFICGRYEGVDERVVEKLVDIELSLGDYIISGGELAAAVMIDAIVRLLPEVIKNPQSLQTDSFNSDNLLSYPVYTRPRIFQGMSVPDVLLSGDHKRIQQWRHEQAIKRTSQRRPDLIEKLNQLPQ